MSQHPALVLEALRLALTRAMPEQKQDRREDMVIAFLDSSRSHLPQLTSGGTSLSAIICRGHRVFRWLLLETPACFV